MWGFLCGVSRATGTHSTTKKTSDTGEEEHDRSGVFQQRGIRNLRRHLQFAQDEVGMEQALQTAGQIIKPS